MKKIHVVFWLLACMCFFPIEYAWADLPGTIGDIHEHTTLPRGDVTALIPVAIELVLAVFSILLTVVAIYAGVLFVGNFGDEDAITRAKKLLIWSLVGVAVTATSYAIVAGVISLDFSQTGG